MTIKDKSKGFVGKLELESLIQSLGLRRIVSFLISLSERMVRGKDWLRWGDEGLWMVKCEGVGGGEEGRGRKLEPSVNCSSVSGLYTVACRTT